MKCSLSPYELKVKASQQKRRGYLLRLEGPSGSFGYSDLFPWVQYGDPAFKEIPRLLEEAPQSFGLLKRSLELAELDLKAREGGVDLTGQLKFQNHFLIPVSDPLTEVEKALEQGFVKFKLKCGRDLGKEVALLHSIKKNFSKDVLIRLDFNTRLDFEKESLFWPFLELLDFVEDPYREPTQWKKSRFPLAFDQPGFPCSEVDYEWRIVKPAKQSLPESKENFIFTSYLGHPLGIAHDSYQASLAGEPVTEYGLMSDGYYEPTAFSDALIKRGAELSFQGGLGIGFDSLLKEQVWQSL